MAVQTTDLLLIQRDGTLYKATAADLVALAGGGATITTFTDQTAFDAYTPGANEIAVLDGQVDIQSIGQAIATVKYAAYPL